MSNTKNNDHSISQNALSQGNIFIEAINAFTDNYIWAIRSNDNNALALVDPGDAQVCIDYIEQKGVVLHSILVTHHHQDHIGGIATLLEYAKTKAWSVTVYGPAAENISQVESALKENDVIYLAELACQFTVFDLPGHTKGHIAYYNDTMLFCGDTLFSGGCGRVFEGTHQQMHHSLSKLANLPSNTLLYCAHEYTQANLSFALAVDPHNVNLINYIEQVNIKRKQNKPTIPSTIALELNINPFLRCDEKAVQLAATKHSNQKQQSADEVFSVIRSWKDNF